MFNALITSLSLTIKLQFELVEMVRVLVGIEVLDQFDFELISFQRKMREEVVKVLKYFFKFLNFFDVDEVCNMLAIMLDPRFRSLRVVENLVGPRDVI